MDNLLPLYELHLRMRAGKLHCELQAYCGLQASFACSECVATGER